MRGIWPLALRAAHQCRDTRRAAGVQRGVLFGAKAEREAQGPVVSRGGIGFVALSCHRAPVNMHASANSKPIEGALINAPTVLKNRGEKRRTKTHGDRIQRAVRATLRSIK